MASESIVARVKLLFSLCMFLILVHAANVFLQGYLLQFGILPREPTSLPFIFTTVFIHGSWAHLFNNLFGLVIFGSLCLLRGRRYFINASLFIIVVGGLLVWAFGRPAIHIGASGWIFGLWSLSIALAWYQKSFINFAIAVLVLFFYGGMIYGVLPADKAISFEAHLAGAFAGILCAANSRTRKIR